MKKTFMQEAIELARKNIHSGTGGPFGCVIVKDDKIVGEGVNRVTSDHDPTAHAEVVAIRNACANLNHFQLTGCEVYTTCEPCPMCLGAIYWARPDRVYFAANRKDAARSGFDDAFIYDEIKKPSNERSIEMSSIERESAITLFEEWKQKEDRIDY
ncbi:MAG: nucleoside deaminase [Balneolaceae bacterium]